MYDNTYSRQSVPVLKAYFKDLHRFHTAVNIASSWNIVWRFSKRTKCPIRVPLPLQVNTSPHKQAPRGNAVLLKGGVKPPQLGKAPNDFTSVTKKDRSRD